jgi:hypothetical protein
MHASEVTRELAGMYSQGVDFSQPANQRIALRLLGADDGDGVILLTRMRTVAPADCGAPAAPGACANEGYAVVVQQVVIGDPALRPSSLGMPGNVDRTTGKVPDWQHDPSARVADSRVVIKAGESAYAAETFLVAPDGRSGVYARTLF